VLAADRGTVLARLQSGIVVTWRRAATQPQRGREHTDDSTVQSPYSSVKEKS
jgi:hypothetical protein